MLRQAKALFGVSPELVGIVLNFLPIAEERPAFSATKAGNPTFLASRSSDEVVIRSMTLSELFRQQSVWGVDGWHVE
jgi:hypothetical protein